MNNETIRHFMSTLKKSAALTAKEKQILIHRLQFKQLRIIAKKFKLSSERVRQIEKQALKKFKDTSQPSLFK